jgi:hypothetical protein
MKYRTDFVTNSSCASSILVSVWTTETIHIYNSMNNTEYVDWQYSDNHGLNNYEKVIKALLYIRLLQLDIDYVNKIFKSNFDFDFGGDSIYELWEYIKELKIDTLEKFDEFSKLHQLIPDNEVVLGAFLEYNWQGWQGEFQAPIYESDFSVINLDGYKITTVGFMDKEKVINTITEARGEYCETLDNSVKYIIVGRNPGKKLEEAISLGIKQIPAYYFENNCEGIEGNCEYVDDEKILLWYENCGFQINGYPKKEI